MYPNKFVLQCKSVIYSQGESLVTPGPKYTKRINQGIFAPLCAIISSTISNAILKIWDSFNDRKVLNLADKVLKLGICTL